MASPKLRLPNRTLTIEELAEYPVALQYPDTIHAQLQSAWFNRAGFPLRNTMLVHSVVVLGEMTCAGVAVAHLPVGYFGAELRSKELVRIKVTPDLADAQYFAVYRRGAPHRLAAEIATMAKETANFRMRRRT